MKAGVPGVGRFGALLHRRRKALESGRFSILVIGFRVAASLSLGKLKSRMRPDSAAKAAYLVRCDSPER